jgi:hypothetical protein
MSIVVDVYAITIFPFIISKEEMSEITLNHETIHIQQQKELFVLGFYPLYFFFYLWGFIKYKDKHQAYYRIPFEQEAFENDQNLNYLKDRKSFSWREFKV